MKYLFTIMLVVSNILILKTQKVVTYDVPKSLYYKIHNDDYTVKVRLPGKNWVDLYEYNVNVDMDKDAHASMVTFDFEDEVEVMVQKNNGMLNTVSIRPLSYNIQPLIKGNTVTFILTEPKNLTVDFNGDKLQNLHVFANELLKGKPDKNDPDVIYFGPGVHEPSDKPGQTFNIASNKTVYIDGGAILKGKLLIDNNENVRIIGRGIVYQTERGVEIRHSKNVTVDGIIFINPKHYTIYGGQSDSIHINNIKSFSCGPWTDGIDLMSCSDVKIDNVFMRNSDDCIAIYGHRWDFYGNSRNITVQNSVLWADIAHPINIGVHGDAKNGGDTIENISVKNICILEHDEDDRDAQGCFAIGCTDNNLIRNVTFEDIRIEDFQEGQLFNFRVFFSEKYSHAPGWGVYNVKLKNIEYNGHGENPSIIEGHSEDRFVRDITIEGLKINGKTIKNAEEMNLKIGSFTKNISFK